MHIWYDIENKGTYQKKLHQTILITITITIFVVILLSILLILNQGTPLNSSSYLYAISVIIFILFFVGVGLFSGIRSIKSNILKFILYGLFIINYWYYIFRKQDLQIYLERHFSMVI